MLAEGRAQRDPSEVSEVDGGSDSEDDSGAANAPTFGHNCLHATLRLCWPLQRHAAEQNQTRCTVGVFALHAVASPH